MNGPVTRTDNRIEVVGPLGDFHRFLSQVHTAIEKKGYEEIILDLRQCTSAFQNSMLSLCAQVMAYRKGGIDFSLIPPDEKRLSNLFQNTGWAHYLDPGQFDPPAFCGHARIPATQYESPKEQQLAVNAIVKVILGAIPDLQRSDFAAFEWSVNEITDNVLVHAYSPIGGLVQVSTDRKSEKQVAFVVADAGVGIPKTLREGHPELTSDASALDRVIREGVTRDKKIGQGNGLFGSYEICSQCNGYFAIHSGHARLEFDARRGLSVSDERTPYNGTLVIATIDFSQPKLLENALRFEGRKYTPVDFIETEYEEYNGDHIRFMLSKESASFGSRVAGRPIRTKLFNLLRMGGNERIYIDCSDVALMSSSFADEAFGKLFLEAGPVSFMQKFEFVNVAGTVRQLIDKAIAQRMSAGVVD